MREIKYRNGNGDLKSGYESDDGDISAEKAAVHKGAKLLDKILPGWHTKVNLERLNMGSGTMCMMGQLFGDRVEGALAKEMYPDLMEEVKKEHLDGYTRAFPGWGYNDETNATSIIRCLMDKLGIHNKAYFEALDRVCSGHDNKCLWAEEIAARSAKEN